MSGVALEDNFQEINTENLDLLGVICEEDQGLKAFGALQDQDLNQCLIFAINCGSAFSHVKPVEHKWVWLYKMKYAQKNIIVQQQAHTVVTEINTQE